MTPQQEVAEAPLTDEQLRGLLGVGRTTFYEWKRLGRYRALLCNPQLTPTARYSRPLVERWLRGEALSAWPLRKRA